MRWLSCLPRLHGGSDLCLQHRKIFLKEHKVYTAAALEKHEFGEGEKELDQHQWCEFCTRLFFDKVHTASALSEQAPRANIRTPMRDRTTSSSIL